MSNLTRRDFLRGLCAVGAVVALESVIGKGASVQDQASDNSPIVDMPGPEYLKCSMDIDGLAAIRWAGAEPPFLVVGGNGILVFSADDGKTWEQV